MIKQKGVRNIEGSYIYIVLSKTGTWLSKSIGKVTNSEYTHVALSLDSEFNKMYTFGRLNPDNPFVGGLTIENLYDGVYKKFSGCKCLIYRLWVTNEQLESLKREIKFYLDSDIEYKYNFIGLFAVLLDKPLKRKEHYFCSEFITTLLENSDIWKSDKVPELTRPMDLLSINNKEIIYEGLVEDFVKDERKLVIAI